VIVGLGGVAGHGHRFIGDDDAGYCYRAVLTQNVTAVTGACLVVKRDDYLGVGGLDEENLAVAFNDVDFCLELVRKGRRNVYTPYAKLFHHESVSRGRDDTPAKQEVFAREFEYMKQKWGDRLKSDEAYNANLSYENEGFHLI
jgi:GT2 family glycosyltransferase